jgi:hypothetical protein
LDDGIWPNTLDQFILADEIASALQQEGQDFKRA